MADIPINAVTRRVQFTGNTGTGPFAFTFEILANTDIAVYKNATLLTLTTDYTVTINANGTGSVTLTGSGSGTALVASDYLTIIGNKPLARTTDFTTAGDLLASALNDQLDANVIMNQQLDERVDRALRQDPDDVDGDMTIPAKADRLGKLLRFNATSGNPEAVLESDILGSGAFNVYNFTGDGSDTTFVLGTAPGVENNTQVYIDGVYQQKNTYTLSGSTITFSAAPPNLSTIEVMVMVPVPLNTVSASGVSFVQSGSTDTRTVQAKLEESVSVKDFGAVGDGVTDDAPAFRLAIAASKNIFVPAGNYLIGSNIDINTSATFVGEGVQATYIERGYSPAQDYEGIFAFGDGSSASGIRNMTLLSKTGQSGGCLISIKPTATGTLGLYRFDNVDLTTTGTSTHDYTIYMDGTAKITAPIGIRGVDFSACNVFGGGISTILVKGVLKFSFVGGGTYPAGGAAASNVRMDGTASVPTSSFVFLPSDCSCPISFDRAQSGIFGCGLMGAITNTGNTAYLTGFGYSASVQSNWTNTIFSNTNTGIEIASNASFSNIPSPSYAVEVLGNITGYSRPGTVTHIGQTGVAYQTNTLDGEVFTFTTASAKLFTISTGGGAACLVFADYKQATITLLSNPSAEFEASASPAAGKTGIYKSANNHTISIVNNTGGASNYNILFVGSVTGATDPA